MAGRKRLLTSRNHEILWAAVVGIALTSLTLVITWMVSESMVGVIIVLPIVIICVAMILAIAKDAVFHREFQEKLRLRLVQQREHETDRQEKERLWRRSRLEEA